LREIIRSHDISDAVNGVDFASFSCLSNITQSGSGAAGEDNKKTRAATAELRAEADCLPPDWILPGSTEVPLKPLIPLPNANNKQGETSALSPNQYFALKQISFSPFNPPPGSRKMKVSIH
jgi:hypothetical protein